MASEFVEGQIKSLGVAGAIITTLMGVIVILSGVIAVMYRQANKVYGYRLGERDTLQTALNDSKNAMREMIEATKDRNEITEELSDLIAKQTQAFGTLELNIKNHYENLRNDHARLEIVVAALPDAIRTMTATLMTLRETVHNISTDIKASVQTSLTAFATEVRNFISNTIDTFKKQRQPR